MKIIFFGNTKYSLVGAQIIHNRLGLSYIVTLPDRPDKRGKLIPSPLKTFGLKNNIPVLEVNKITEEIITQIKNLQPDFFVVEDYGLILPSKLLTLPKSIALNIHHSLLPKYRGSSPAPTAILNGDSITGVSIIKMTDKLDAGDILAQKEYIIKPNETTASLLQNLNDLGGQLTIPILKDYSNFAKSAKKQDEAQATYTKKITKADGYIEANNPPNPTKLNRMIRAYFPWPTVWTRLTINGQEKIVKLLPENQIQVEGKNPMSVKDFINGYPDLKEVIEKIFKP